MTFALLLSPWKSCGSIIVMDLARRKTLTLGVSETHFPACDLYRASFVFFPRNFFHREEMVFFGKHPSVLHGAIRDKKSKKVVCTVLAFLGLQYYSPLKSPKYVRMEWTLRKNNGPLKLEVLVNPPPFPTGVRDTMTSLSSPSTANMPCLS